MAGCNVVQIVGKVCLGPGSLSENDYQDIILFSPTSLIIVIFHYVVVSMSSS